MFFLCYRVFNEFADIICLTVNTVIICGKIPLFDHVGTRFAYSKNWRKTNLALKELFRCGRKLFFEYADWVSISRQYHCSTTWELVLPLLKLKANWHGEYLMFPCRVKSYFLQVFWASVHFHSDTTIPIFFLISFFSSIHPDLMFRQSLLYFADL